MIFDLQRGLVDSLINIRPSVSDFVWMENDRWIATLSYAFSNLLEIRAYDLHTHVSVVLAQRLPFDQRQLLFGIGDTLAFFVQSPPRLSVFDQRQRSITPWFTIPEGEGEMRAMEWDASGENLFVWLDNGQAGAIFYLVKPNAAQRYAKNVGYTSVSLHPEGRHFLAVSSDLQVPGHFNLVREALATDERQLLYSWRTAKSVHIHHSGNFAALLDQYLSGGGNLPQPNLYILELSSNAFIDSLELPEAGFSNQFQWIVPKTVTASFSAIWQVRQWNSSRYEYFHLSLAPRFNVLVYTLPNVYPFAVIPKEEKFSLLLGNTLMTVPLNTKVDP